MDQGLIVDIAEKIIMAIMTGFLGMIVRVGSGMWKTMATMNIQLAVIIERIAQHETRIVNLEDKK